MAKFCATIIALFCLFSLSHARSPPENDGITTSVSLPLSEASPAVLRLPREPISTEAESNSAVLTSVPLTKINFRPVNRRFRVRSKPCRYHFRVHPTMRENEEIPYGNDMIVSSGENSDFENPVLRRGGRRIPGRWVRMHHHHYHHDDKDSDSDDEDRIKNIAFKLYGYDRFDREKKLKMLKKMRKNFRIQNEDEGKKKKGGFMIRVRKFLDHYF